MVLLSSQSSQGSPLSPEKKPKRPSDLPGPCCSRCTTPLSSHPSWVLPSQSSTSGSSDEPQGLCTSPQVAGKSYLPPQVLDTAWAL